MTSIPETHKKYGVLPYCIKYNKDCCEYDSSLLDKVEKAVGKDYQLTPYGIDSIEAYLKELDDVANDFPDSIEIQKLMEQYKQSILDLNDKNYWSILRYVYEDYDRCTGLTKGKCYYWPCSKTKPEFRGVIDDEEFTAYQYPVNREYWEILVDPTGMAEYTINNPPKHRFHSIEQQRASMEAIAREAILLEEP